MRAGIQEVLTGMGMLSKGAHIRKFGDEVDLSCRMSVSNLPGKFDERI